MASITPIAERLEVEIASGQSLSPAINLGGRTLVGVFMPATWTAADLSFQAALNDDGAAWQNPFVGGSERTVIAGAGQYVAVNPTDFIGVNYMKIRSGTSGTPVPQPAARTLVLMLSS